MEKRLPKILPYRVTTYFILSADSSIGLSQFLKSVNRESQFFRKE